MLNNFTNNLNDNHDVVETVILEDGSVVKVTAPHGQGYPEDLKAKKVSSRKHMCRANRFEGDTRHPLYFTFKMMTDCCENPHRKDYAYYGAKGITVCPEWHFPENFVPFLNWAHEHGYSEDNHMNLKLVRIDKSKGFNPDNCKFTLR